MFKIWFENLSSSLTRDIGDFGDFVLFPFFPSNFFFFFFYNFHFSSIFGRHSFYYNMTTFHKLKSRHAMHSLYLCRCEQGERRGE